MLQTVFASLWALATLIVYQVACDRWDADSVRRRQVDAWAALSALLALGIILYGGAQVGRAAMEQPDSPVPGERVPERVASVEPLPQGGALDAPGAAVASVADGQPIAPAGSAPLPAAAVPGEAPALGQENVREADPAQAGRRPDPVAAAPEAAAPAPGLAPAPGSELAQPQPAQPDPAGDDPVRLVPVTPTARAAALPPPALQPIIVPPVVEPISPTVQPEPTALPELPAVPTPACGDPRLLRVSLNIEEARAERDGDRQSVRFRARLRNDSGFPIVATGMVAVAQDGRSSADQFGVERLPDVQIEALAQLSISGAVALAKQPSPMSRSELCISFVAETCGLRSDSPLTRRCFQIGGF